MKINIPTLERRASVRTPETDLAYALDTVQSRGGSLTREPDGGFYLEMGVKSVHVETEAEAAHWARTTALTLVATYGNVPLCKFCKQLMRPPTEPYGRDTDCGGDCARCMAVIVGDPHEMDALIDMGESLTPEEIVEAQANRLCEPYRLQ